MLPTWINASTLPKKTDKMKHKQKNARKTKGTHVRVAKPVPQNQGTLRHTCCTLAKPMPYLDGTQVAPCNKRATLGIECKERANQTPTLYAKNVP